MTIGVDEPQVDELLTEPRRSHYGLVITLSGLSDQQVAGRSYADEWSIAQVASHLGSGAEIFALFLDAGLRHSTPPGAEEFQPIWSRWNAKSPPEQSRDAVVARAGKAMPNPRAVHVLTPHENFVLEPTDDGVRLGPASSEPGEISARLRLPAEAFVRLVYGRLDTAHTPASVEAGGVDLADLRSTFPGI